MEGTHSTHLLYSPIEEKVSRTQCFPTHRAPAGQQTSTFFKKQPIATHSGLWEEPTEAKRRSQADERDSRSFKEALKPNSSSDLFWLTDLLPLCYQCKSMLGMGNQGGKTKNHGSLETQEGSPGSPHPQTAKRRRSTEGSRCTSKLEHTLAQSSRSSRGTSRGRRLKRLWMMRSPPAEEQLDWGPTEQSPPSEVQSFSTAGRASVVRAAVMGAKRENLPGVLSSALGEKKVCSGSATSPGSSSRVPRSEIRSLSPRDVLSLKDVSFHFDSDAELSEYENEMYNACASPSSPQSDGEPLDSTRHSPEGGMAQALSPRQEQRTPGKEWRVERVEMEEREKAAQRRCVEMERRDAAWRVKGKIREVEGIIRRVSFTSGDWIRERREGDDWREGQLFASLPDGCACKETVSEPQPQPLTQPRPQPQPQLDQVIMVSQPQPQVQLEGCSPTQENTLLVEEHLYLGEAFSQRLTRAFWMEGLGEDVDWETMRHGGGLREGRETEWPFSFDPGTPESPSWKSLTQSPNTLELHSDMITFDPFTELEASSPPPLTTLVDTSPLAPSSFHSMSPILYPHPIGPRPALHFLLGPLAQPSEEEEGEEEEGGYEERKTRRVVIDSQGGDRGVGGKTVATKGAVSDKRKSRKRVAWLDQRLSEQNQNQSQDHDQDQVQDQTHSSPSWTTSSVDSVFCSDEALRRQEEVWLREVEESLSVCRSLSRPSRPTHADFLRITPQEDDITSDSSLSPESAGI
ncbi:uncharacterized protein LOC134025178 [Osmerus eperlanus]|uniref:uncharacterized protein LOC134025178 n=1 Tax=Osmerus eperlanus TaxID=29151 RepID=UPI002E0EED4E